MREYICLNCFRVFQTAPPYAKCCGVVEEFSMEKHGRSLVGMSNSWIIVWEKWKDHPSFIVVSDELSNKGCFGAATQVNVFIERLLKNNESILH